MQKLTPEYLPVFCPLTNKRCVYVPECINIKLAPIDLSESGSILPKNAAGLALWCIYFDVIVAYIKEEDNDT